MNEQKTNIGIKLVSRGTDSILPSKKYEWKEIIRSSKLPVLFETKERENNLAQWITDNRGILNQKLHESGAILFRGFDLHTDEDFINFLNQDNFEMLSYLERSSPRTAIAKNVFTSTTYPKDEIIALHNENSASKIIAKRLWFFCSEASEKGGETPLADARKVLKAIDTEVVEKFRSLGWMLIRNYSDVLGYSWEKAFSGLNKADVERYCRVNSIDFRWKEDNILWTKQTRPSTLIHPITGEEAWFNHIAFWHSSNLPTEIRSMMQDEVGEEGMPYDVRYGDGSKIEDDIAKHLRNAYLKEKVKFSWRNGDLLLVDNILTCHGRESYSGSRKVRVAMTDSFIRTDL
ncbi:TauD/TfdA family dioxygenase [Microbulbifer epialgicus]|uniref:TauD/TfdA family dioxygenase n=1 Tax=Microbulbifer epialgicus TaxID=393907 RepID=A0ABV4P3D9_9GAMM